MSAYELSALGHKLHYVANARIPSEKAHVLQIFMMCQAFARQGYAVTLVYPQRKNNQQMSAVTDIWRFFNISCEFGLQKLTSLDWIWLENIKQGLRYRIQSLSFMLAVRKYLAHRAEIKLLYSRDIYSVLRLSMSALRRRLIIVYEAHDYPKRFPNWQVQRLVRGLDGLVVVNNWLKNKWIELGFPVQNIMVAQDGVDLAAYQPGLSKTDAREKLGLNGTEKLIFYTGHLYPWSGVYTLADASRYLPDGYRVCFLGGMPEHQAKLDNYCNQERLTKVKLLGYVTPGEVPDYLAAADVLVMPYSGKSQRMREVISPLKLFEYMAAGRPIIAADLPSLGEVLQDGEDALMFNPDDPESLAQQVIRVIEDHKLAERLARAAKQKAAAFSWERRAASICWFMQQLI
jgi:glycosyltransferase involved in cell wall biosynthesis